MRLTALATLGVAALAASPAAGAGTTVTLADTGTPTSRIGAEMDAQALAAQGFTVNRAGSLAPAAAAAALRDGAIDAYVTDTGTLLERILARPRERDGARLPGAIAAHLAPRGAQALGWAVADDAAAVACTRATVRAHRLTGVFSLVAAGRRLTYGATPEHVVRADGLAALRTRFNRVVVAKGAARFDLVRRRRVHCVQSSGTEPWAVRLGLSTLRDGTRRLAGTPRRTVTVVGDGYLSGAPAAFVPALDRVAALQTVATVAALRGQIDIDGVPAADAVAAVLRANQVIP